MAKRETKPSSDPAAPAKAAAPGTTDPADAATAAPSFEQALDRLEQIARQLDEGALPLAESLARYEEGVRLLRHCQKLLEQAERKIELLTGVDAEGNPLTQPFDAEATFSADEARLPRNRRRAVDDLGETTG